MKILILSIVLVFTSALFYGHPPSDIKLIYDPETRLINITIEHSISNSTISDPAKHFIKVVEVSINGKRTIVQTFQKQENLDGDTLVYKIPADSGDKVTVSAVCSIFGSAQKEILIQ